MVYTVARVLLLEDNLFNYLPSLSIDGDDDDDDLEYKNSRDAIMYTFYTEKKASRLARSTFSYVRSHVTSNTRIHYNNKYNRINNVRSQVFNSGSKSTWPRRYNIPTTRILLLCYDCVTCSFVWTYSKYTAAKQCVLV